MICYGWWSHGCAAVHVCDSKDDIELILALHKWNKRCIYLVMVVWTRQNGDELIIWLCGYTVRLRLLCSPVRVKFSGYSPYRIHLTGGCKYRMAFVQNLFTRTLRTFTQHISTNLPFFSLYILLPVNGSV